MKKVLLNIIFSIILFMAAISLTGCDIGGNPPGVKDYNADIEIVEPENIKTENFIVEENTTYYTSPGFSLFISVRGHFTTMDYFILEDHKRIYDNLYFYENDYFYIVTDDYVDLFASLAEESDKQYAEEEKQQGHDIQLNIKKSGIYTVIFDTKTLKFDLVHKSEIKTPKYYTIKNCDIFTVATNWVEMSKNPNNSDEFQILNFNVATGKAINFYNHLHTSNYYPTLESNSQKYANCRKTNVEIFIGGNYNIFINSKTYEVRLELINTETADYTCVYYDGSNFITLTPQSANAPYIFNYQIYADEQYVNVPSFYNKSYKKYLLSVTNSPDVSGSGNYHYFKKIGTYNITINLKAFELTAELLPE